MPVFLRRTSALLLRQYYLLRGSPARIVPLFSWVAIDIILWGFITAISTPFPARASTSCPPCSAPSCSGISWRASCRASPPPSSKTSGPAISSTSSLAAFRFGIPRRPRAFFDRHQRHRSGGDGRPRHAGLRPVILRLRRDARRVSSRPLPLRDLPRHLRQRARSPLWPRRRMVHLAHSRLHLAARLRLLPALHAAALDAMAGPHHPPSYVFEGMRQILSRQTGASPQAAHAIAVAPLLIGSVLGWFTC